MKISILCVITLLSVQTVLWGSNIDSLIQATNTVTDKEQLFNLYLQLTDVLKYNNDKRYVEYLNKALTLSEDLSEKYKSEARGLQAQHLLSTGERDQAVQMATEIMDKSTDPQSLLFAHMVISDYLRMSENMDSAFYHHKIMANLAEANDLKQYKSRCYRYMAIQNTMRSNYAAADSFFHLSLDAARDVHAQEDVEIVLYNLGIVSYKAGLFEKANAYFLEGYQEAKKSGNASNLVGCIGQIARYSYTNSDTTQAFKYWEEGDAIIQKEKLNDVGVSDLYNVFAKSLITSGRLDHAFSISQKLIAIGESTSSKVKSAAGLALQAHIYALKNEVGKSKILIDQLLPQLDVISKDYWGLNVLDPLLDALILNGNFKDAERVFNRYKILRQQFNSSSVDEEFLEKKYKIQKGLGNYSLALEAYEDYAKIKDSIRIAISSKTLMEAQTKFESNEKELNNQALMVKNKVISANNKLMTLGLGLLIAMLIVMGFLYANNVRAKGIITSQNHELSELNNTKNRLFAIISHDLRNEVSAFQNLNNIFGYHLKAGNYDRLESLTQQVDKSAVTVNALMDNLLKWSSSQLKGIELHPESLSVSQNTKSIIQLFEQYAETKQIRITHHIDDDLQVQADADSFQFILRNIISNALKYTPAGGNIEISSSESSEGIAIRIRDTGGGISVEKLNTIWEIDKKSSNPGTLGERGAGIGLSLVKDFVQRNNGQIHIESTEGMGTLVTVLLPKAA